MIGRLGAPGRWRGRCNSTVQMMDIATLHASVTSRWCGPHQSLEYVAITKYTVFVMRDIILTAITQASVHKKVSLNLTSFICKFICINKMCKCAWSESNANSSESNRLHIVYTNIFDV